MAAHLYWKFLWWQQERNSSTIDEISKMRAAGITLLSLALTTAVIGNAYYQKKQFYPSVVYITKSNPSMAVGKSLLHLWQVQYDLH